MLLKDGGSQYVENLKFRDAWYLVKSIKLNHSNNYVNIESRQIMKDFYKEEVCVNKILI